MGSSKRLTPKQKKIVNVAWKHVKGFIKDWQDSPFEWNTERDIQVEIASRIKSELKKHNMHTIMARYSYKEPEELEGRQPYNRICCEQPVFIGENVKKRHCRRPDIVIFDDLRDPDNPPDIKDRHLTRKNCPILWVCEIKYKQEWNTKRHNEKSNKDLKTLEHLRRQKDTQYTCWLNISRERAKSGNGFVELSKTRRFRKYNIKLPSK